MMFRAGITFLFFLFALSNCANALTFAQTQKGREIGQQMGEFSLSGIGDKGQKSWDVSGKSADIDGNTINLSDIVSNFYGEEENVKLTAEKGDFDRQQGNLHLEKDVVVTTSSGARLTTDSLDWDRQARTVATKDPVRIKKEEMIITAQGAKGYQDLNKVDLEKDVQVEINQKEGQPASGSEKNKIIIDCDGPLQVDYKNNIATFNNNVRVQTQDALIVSDLMDVYFAPGQKDKPSASPGASVGGAEVEKIIARGNVKITREKNVSYSEEAVYNTLERKITLSGKPKVVIYSTQGLNNASSGN
jgi:LPS export ABC transporter protein LptC